MSETEAAERMVRRVRAMQLTPEQGLVLADALAEFVEDIKAVLAAQTLAELLTEHLSDDEEAPPPATEEGPD